MIAYVISDSLHIAYVTDVQLIMYYCGNNDVNCTHGKASSFSRYPYLDEQLERHFTDVVNNLCFTEKHIYNIPQGKGIQYSRFGITCIIATESCFGVL